MTFFDRTIACVVDGVTYRFTVDRLGYAGIAMPDAEARTAGFDGPTALASEHAADLVRAAADCATASVPRSELQRFVGASCKACRDERYLTCKPCDACEWEGWRLCTCATKEGSAPAYGWPLTERHYDTGLVRVVLATLPDGSALAVGEVANPGYKFTKGKKRRRARSNVAAPRMLVLRVDQHVAVVSEIMSEPERTYPRFEWSAA